MVLATIKTSKLLVTEPLTPELFAPFGGVISSSHQLDKVASASANYGTATKLFKVSPIVNNYAKAASNKPATANWNMFRCSRPNHLIDNDRTYHSKVLERHPYSTQTFLPLGQAASKVAYMVIVAPTLTKSGFPDIDNAQAFTCRGDQAVTYGAATWHAPMIALTEDPVDFAVLIHENGVTEEDCEEVYLDEMEVEFTTSTAEAPSARKPQSEEEFQSQLAEFRSTGPRGPDMDEPKLNADTHLDQKDIKYAAERQYYLKNYQAAIDLVDSGIPKVSGKLVQELQEIKDRALEKLASSS